jgi:hypothetical protein
LVAIAIDPVFLPQIPHNFGRYEIPASLFKAGTLLFWVGLRDNSEEFPAPIPLPLNVP